MKIFKFGGASVKDANAVINLERIIKRDGLENTLVVISAMGKITNELELLVKYYLDKDTNKINKQLKFIKQFHQKHYEDLFGKDHESFESIEKLLFELERFLDNNASTNYNLVYDQIVPFGELLSTMIISNYLNHQGINNQWLDVRKFIKTDATFRDAKVDLKVTSENISKIDTTKLNITQGFIGRNENNTTTLGREGSDYTAGIFAYCLNANSVTIWKDVEGILNADPREFFETILLENVSYTEAIEMAFYGASVIHPKTIQPLEQKNIPLFVRSFVELDKKGTCVSKGKGIFPKTPCFIVKKNQISLSVSSKDLSFVMEDNISSIFKKIHDYQIKVNLIQNSAISFSICIEDKYSNFDKLYRDLEQDYNLVFHKNVTLHTIRHFDDKAIEKIEQKGETIIKQMTAETAQLVIEE